MTWETLLNLFRGTKDAARQAHTTTAVKAFRKRYARFRKLLDANAALGELMANMERKLSGKSLFGSVYVRGAVKSALDLSHRMVISLQGMRAARYNGLSDAFERIAAELRAFLPQEREYMAGDELLPLTLDIRQTHAGMVDMVGGKCANLGEMASRAGLPVPRGFAVTLHAFRLFMAHDGLNTRITQLAGNMDAVLEEREELARILEEIRALIEAAPLPPTLAGALEEALAHSFGAEDVRLAVRSSALSEDGDKSFAGQFLSELGVAREDLRESYKRVVASLFTPSATVYRLHQGIPLEDSGMAVACIEMVDAVASGVSYSHDPANLLNESMIISSIWGLGRYLVDDMVQPDTWVFTRELPHTLIRRKTGRKNRKLALNAGGSPEEQRVPENQQKALCLSEAEALEHAAEVMRLERHYGGYQDIEWAKDRTGRIVYLQSRPLGIRAGSAAPGTPLIRGYPLLLEGGESAYAGIGCGPVVMPRTDEELAAFPKGGVLVVAHSNAAYAQILDRAEAVVTETGGVTGHMATVCREFKVPTVLNAPGAMQRLKPGMQITVDSFSCRVYEGTVEELLPMRMRIDSVLLQDTPVHTQLREAARHILPLNLIDPQAAAFAPEGCRTLHDIMRYVHECSYHEMFAISDSASEADGGAIKFDAPLPIDLYIIDLDRGADLPPGARKATPEQILSVPFRALLRGMMRSDTMFRQPRPINIGGFLSVMGQQMGNPQGGDSRFGDKSYAIISDRYLNFSSRVGYHYSVLDAYCGKTTSKNYISFKFQGGAAGETRRVRRCKSIALIL
ncbi:MAG: phosphoenolpyruvate synthase, partial [Deltaproteobacteria bacterium]|nr:phosphoenolpyruvate synthase [Deltaproteobacteria bacterium]